MMSTVIDIIRLPARPCRGTQRNHHRGPVGGLSSPVAPRRATCPTGGSSRHVTTSPSAPIPKHRSTAAPTARPMRRAGSLAAEEGTASAELSPGSNNLSVASERFRGFDLRLVPVLCPTLVEIIRGIQGGGEYPVARAASLQLTRMDYALDCICARVHS